MKIEKEYFEKRLIEEKESKKLLQVTIADERDFLYCPSDLTDEFSKIRKMKFLEQYPNGVEIEVLDLGRCKKATLLPAIKQSDFWLEKNYLTYSVKGAKNNGCCPAFKINIIETC